jgi:integrase
MSMTTSLNNSEIMGLRWEYVNLTNTVRVVHNDELGDIAIGPRSFGVVENWYLGKRGTVKTTSRNRVQPIPRALLGPLERLLATTRFNAPTDPVFASRVGTPVDLHNADKRVLKDVGEKIGVPGLSWQCFRRTAATLTGLTAMPKADRIALMGHSNSAMTDYYSDSDIERRRTFVDEVADGLVPVAAKSVTNGHEDITVEDLNKLWEKE